MAKIEGIGEKQKIFLESLWLRVGCAVKVDLASLALLS
jgi:hypothetical protein